MHDDHELMRSQMKTILALSILSHFQRRHMQVHHMDMHELCLSPFVTTKYFVEQRY